MNDKTIIAHAVGIISEMCAADEGEIVNLLIGYCWDEEEAGEIKEAIHEGG